MSTTLEITRSMWIPQNTLDEVNIGSDTGLVLSGFVDESRASRMMVHFYVKVFKMKVGV